MGTTFAVAVGSCFEITFDSRKSFLFLNLILPITNNEFVVVQFFIQHRNQSSTILHGLILLICIPQEVNNEWLVSFFEFLRKFVAKFLKTINPSSKFFVSQCSIQSLTKNEGIKMVTLFSKLNF